MFTGIITDIGTVRSAEQRGDLRLAIATGYDLATIDLGASIACSGVCLTVVDKGDDWFAVDVSAETVSRTAADLWREGARLNLERALRIGDELGGHFVTGHVDGVAEVVGAIPRAIRPGSARHAAATRPIHRAQGLDHARRRLADRQRGRATRATRTHFTINLIPHTAQHTTLGSPPGDSSISRSTSLRAIWSG